MPSFPGFSRAIILLFQRLLQQKVYVIMTFIYQVPSNLADIYRAGDHNDSVYPVNSCFTQISDRT